jgi:hypothetical protein
VAATKSSLEAYNRLVQDLSAGTSEILIATSQSQLEGTEQRNLIGEDNFVSSRLSQMFDVRDRTRANARTSNTGQSIMNAIGDTVLGVRGMGDEDFQANSVIDAMAAWLNNMRFQVRQAEERPGIYGPPSENLLRDINSVEETLKELKGIREEIKAFREGGIEAVQRMRSDPRTAASTQAERD